MTSVWSGLAPGRVVRLTDDRRPQAATAGTAPTVVTVRLATVSTTDTTIETILARLDAVARGRYPAWLPGADAVPAPTGAGVAAVRALARRVAADGPQFGPFLADLAERSLRYGSAAGQAAGDDDGRPVAGGRARFPAEVRAAGLARVLADGAGRPCVVLHVVPPDYLSPAARRSLVAACEWLAHHGRFAVALAGDGPEAPPGPADAPTTPASVAGGADGATRAAPAPDAEAVVVETTTWPAGRAGGPHPRSRAEQMLERALAEQPWAAGRAWNAVFQAHPLSPEYRIDLLWRDERCAVEIDGPEHREPRRYEADRRRDTELQLAGFAVLRFTNRQVLSDVAAVVTDIEKLISSRRQKG